MQRKYHLKSKVNKTAQFLWYLQNFIRHGTFSPSIKQIVPIKDRIFVIGNGPSLNTDITSHIKDLCLEDIMMVNQALTHTLAFELKPKYYMLMDPAYWGFYTDKEDIDGGLTQCVKCLNEAFSRVDWEMNVFAPYHYYHKRTAKSLVLNNPKLHIYTFNAVELYTFSMLQRWLYRHNFAIPSGINVLLAGLCCAVTMGYKEIYLLGADSTWHKQLEVDENNRVYSLETHYYHNQKEKIYTPYPLSFHMQCIAEAFKAYDTLGVAFPYIYNLSSVSMIDAFKRKNIDSILGSGGGDTKHLVILIYSLFLIKRGAYVS
ncbi:hypothetical protein [uncultured Helicobacter sp.]|uniref:hypothetical protein n=1 Tax=uncultured Helicobacter sp. TaxID=175537 RepID=UPI0026EE4B98|nr:hypothetical protein [uncultured Helicobacter sp.]